MKRIITLTIVLMTLTACTAPQISSPKGTQPTPGPVSPDVSPANMPNPASVYCTQQGNKLEIVTAADGSQSGRCVFPDGSSCEEWAYFRGECGPAVIEAPTDTNGGKPGGSSSTEEQASADYMTPVVTEQIIDWWGVFKSTDRGAQFDDYFERQDLGQVI